MDTTTPPTSAGRPFKILALDGGGILGAFSAAFLAGIEKLIGAPIATHFDLIAGTSTGAIIGAALAAGEPAARIVQFYKDRGPKIFTRPRPGFFKRAVAFLPNLALKQMGLDYHSLRNPKYEHHELTAALTEVFGSKKIGDIKLTRLLIPTVDMVPGQTVVFKTPHLPNLVRDRHYLITEAIRATTAAPTYFHPPMVAGKGAYADGGVWANNPAMVAVCEAVKIAEVCRRPEIDPEFSLGDVHCLSIGTGTYQYFANPSRGSGIAWWMAGTRIFTVMMASQSQGTNFQMQYMLGKRYKRVDFHVPDGSWVIDNAKVLNELVHLGERKAGEELADVRARFFTSTVQPYRAFPESDDGGKA
jgi:patatin-like phospholipase/acyl hydrolase